MQIGWDLSHLGNVISEVKGSRKNNFAEFSLRFRLNLVDLTELSHRNSELFRGLRERRSAEDGLKMGCPASAG